MNQTDPGSKRRQVAERRWVFFWTAGERYKTTPTVAQYNIIQKINTIRQKEKQSGKREK
jgi:hypothetical protein